MSKLFYKLTLIWKRNGVDVQGCWGSYLEMASEVLKYFLSFCQSLESLISCYFLHVCKGLGYICICFHLCYLTI